MKHLLLGALVAASFSNLANADNGVYVSVKAGISDTKMKSNKLTITIPGNSDVEITTNQGNQSKSAYPNISAAVGYDFSTISNINVRAELEYTYKDKTTFNAETNSIKVVAPGGAATYPTNYELMTNKVESQSLMLNGYYDFKNASKFTPYVSAGVGVTRIKNELKPTSLLSQNSNPHFKTDNHFTWSAGGGVAYNITNNVALDASYRFVNGASYRFVNTDKSESSAGPQNINMTQKYKLTSNDYSLGIRYNF